MENKKIKKEILELNNKLKNYAKQYYENDQPTISDYEYDNLYNQLLEYENKYPQFILNDSVTKKVGSGVSNKFAKVKHEIQMLSLNNAFGKEDLFDFDKKIKKELALSEYENIEYICEYKIDGLSISLIYDKGRLQKAVTRGDGVIGEDVTDNVIMIKNIPLTIPYKHSLEARGEIYIPLDIFCKINQTENNKYANPRNLASGTLRQLNSQIVKERKLSAFIYQIPNPEKYNLESQDKVLNFLDQNNFPINKSTKKTSNIKEAYEVIESFINSREDINYDVDGIVIKVNDVSLYEDIGSTAKFPKYMIAYKFPAEIASTKLLGIFPTVGRTGRITYNAKLEPVKLVGTVVGAATLHNADYIKLIDINVGDDVNVKKAGDIIPKVLGVAKKNNPVKWVKEQKCPSCQEDLIQYTGEVDQYCVNKNCFEIRLGKLIHFVSKKAMNIEGVSSEILRLFLNKKIITNYSSIFEIKKQQLLNLDGFKEKSISNVLKAIENAKNNDFDKFIFGLGIRHVGSKNAKILAKRFGTLDDLIKATREEIISIRNLGEKVQNSLIEYFSGSDSKENLFQINKCINLGLDLKESKKPISDILLGKTFVITGTLTKGREFFKEKIELYRGNVANTISRKTDYLLLGENAGSKIMKAKEYNIKIINEIEFNEICGE